VLPLTAVTVSQAAPSPRRSSSVTGQSVKTTGTLAVLAATRRYSKALRPPQFHCATSLSSRVGPRFGASRHTRHLFAFRIGKFGFRRTLNVCPWNFILSRAGWYHCCQHANVSRSVCRYLLFAQVHVLEVPGSNPYIPSFTVVLSWYRWPVCEISCYTLLPYAELGYQKAKSKNT
jgi:hypothetical protein